MRIALVALLLLAGCGQEAAIKRQVAAVMKDPASADFGEILIRGEGANLTACGAVNAKNAFGAYVGQTPFMVKGGSLYMPVSPVCCKLTMVEERETTAGLHRECEAERPPPLPLGD